MFKLQLFLHTVRYLRPIQIAYQIKYRLHKAKYHPMSAPKTVAAIPEWTEWIRKRECLMDDGTFCFLNLKESFSDWNPNEHGGLWAYNLNYMDWLCQERMTLTVGTQWIDRFITELPSNRIGLAPYPIALRNINWIKFICLHDAEITEERRKLWNDTLYSQYSLLEKKLEFHLLGNHLLEDAYSLFIGSVYFRDKRLYKKASRLLQRELTEQILADGAHYEQSPMYHSILLDRLLDCISLAQKAEGLDGLQEIIAFLMKRATLMLGHLANMCYEDGTYPLFGDSSLGIAPTPRQLFDYAQRLGLTWKPLPLSVCGYRHFHKGNMEAFVDVGNITATYQPGHTHADTLNFELRIGGKPFIVDTGISTYNKTARRLYERSTEAHNTVTIEDRNSSSEVWSGFRVGKRAKVKLLQDNEKMVHACHDGYAPAMHERMFIMDNYCCTIKDSVIGTYPPAHCCLHLASDIKILSQDHDCIVTNRGSLNIHGANNVTINSCCYSETYNEFINSLLIDVAFTETLTIEIKQ